MRVTVKTTGMTLTPALAVYLSERLETIAKLLERVERRGGNTKVGQRAPVVARVELARTTRHHNKGDVFRAELTLELPGKDTVRAVAERADLRLAMDRMRDEAQRAIRQRKERKAALVRKGGREMKRRIRNA